MLNPKQLLEAFDRHSPVPVLASTGLGELDELTGGLSPRSVWLVTGGVGEGKTTLLLQLAVVLARAHHAVQLACPREPTEWITKRMLAQLGRIPLSHLEGDRPREADPTTLQRARDLLATLPITVSSLNCRPFTPETDPYGSAPKPTALLIDDADQIGGMTPARLAQYATDEFLTIATLPRNVLLERPGDFGPVQPEGGRVSDLVLEVRTRDLGTILDPLDPGHDRTADLRPGEADMVLHRHRWKPTRTVHVAFRGHYSEFRSLEA